MLHLTERQLYDSVLGQTFQSQGTSEEVSRLVRTAIGAHLHDVGVDLAQGYHFGRPEPWRGHQPDRAPSLMPLMAAPSLA